MNHPEQLLHYIWRFKLYGSSTFVTTDGLPVEIIDNGMINTDAGPDFFNAKIRLNDKTWAGNIEIHKKSSDWTKHKHHTDPAYDSVILHVVEKWDAAVYSSKGQEIPQIVLEIPNEIATNYLHLLASPFIIPCSTKINSIPKIYFTQWMHALLAERLERKINNIFTILDKFNNSWDETFYVLLARNFGFGLNSEVFERLALSLPYSFIQKHSDSIFQVEALLLGQAGQLEDEAIIDDYYLQLKKEYNFLKVKYTLSNLDGFLFKSLRTRPQSFPQIRIAQLAAVLQQSRRLFSHLLAQEDVNRLRLFFHINASEYWQTHYTFGKPSSKRSKYLGDSSLDIILINTVAPILFAYGKRNDIESYCTRALNLLETIKPERNSIITNFKELGINSLNAADTQSLIQLKKEYCDKRKCLFCKIGFQILSSKAQTV